MHALLAALIWNTLTAVPLAAMIFAACRLRFLRVRPALAHLLWLLVLVKLVTPPFLAVPVLPAVEAELQVAATALAAPTTGPAELAIEEVAATSAESLSPPSTAIIAGYLLRALPVLLAMLWLAGSLFLLLTCLLQTRRVARLLRHTPMADGNLQALAGRVARQLGLQRAPEFRVVHAAITPFLWAAPRRPLIVVPKPFFDLLSTAQQEDVIAHELAHYVRKDHWTNLVSFLVTAAFWWHPVAWWARAEIRKAQELCCDAMVVGRCAGKKRAYAATLLQAMDFTARQRTLLPELASGFGQVSFLKERFELLLHPRLNHRLSWWMYPLLVGVVGLLPCVPVPMRAQESEPLLAEDRSAELPAAAAAPAIEAEAPQSFAAVPVSLTPRAAEPMAPAPVAAVAVAPAETAPPEPLGQEIMAVELAANEEEASEFAPEEIAADEKPHPKNKKERRLVKRTNRLNTEFEKKDTDQNGLLSVEEYTSVADFLLRTVFGDGRPHPHESAAEFEARRENLEVALKKFEAEEKEALVQQFEAQDLNGDGAIDRKEFLVRVNFKAVHNQHAPSAEANNSD